MTHVNEAMTRMAITICEMRSVKTPGFEVVEEITGREDGAGDLVVLTTGVELDEGSQQAGGHRTQKWERKKQGWERTIVKGDGVTTESLVLDGSWDVVVSFNSLLACGLGFVVRLGWSDG